MMINREHYLGVAKYEQARRFMNMLELARNFERPSYMVEMKNKEIPKAEIGICCMYRKSRMHKYFYPIWHNLA